MANFLREDKSGEETTGPNSTLNPNSYAAMAVFGTVELAVDTLHDAGFALKPAAVDELWQTFAAVIATVQNGFTGRTSMQEGMNIWLRGALRAAIKTPPCPLGGTTEDLSEWVEAITRRTRSIAVAAIRLWDGGEPSVPAQFTALTGLRKARPAA